MFKLRFSLMEVNIVSPIIMAGFDYFVLIGVLENSLTIKPEDDNLDSAGFFGCSFSPNSRFPLCFISMILPNMILGSNMIADVIHIAAWDSFVDPIFGEKEQPKNPAESRLSSLPVYS